MLENARPVDGLLPLSVMFDGQMWLGPGRILTGVFRYYNSSNYSFPDVGQYFAWIHVAKFVPAEGEVETASERQAKAKAKAKEEQQKDDKVAAKSDDAPADTLDEPDIVHVVGDIVQLIPTNTEDMKQQTYITVSGAAVNSNKTVDSFEVNAAQYTSHYKDNRPLSILPVRAHFSLKKYKARKPMPPDNTYVSVEGFLEDIETDTAGHAALFHMSVDNISFLGRATSSFPISFGLGPSTPSRSSRFKYNFDAPSPSPSTSTQLSAPSTPSTSDSGLL